jgi:hypothetical protein
VNTKVFELKNKLKNMKKFDLEAGGRVVLGERMAR